MNGMEVMLPGGLSKNGNIQRQAKFLPLTGRIEQALIEYGNVLNRPEYVTSILSSVLDCIGDQKADAECVSDLCMADRQYLMLRLAAILDGEQMWLYVGCSHCNALFDVDVQRCDLPVKKAGQGFPFVTLHLNEWTIVARIPTGVDQQHLGKLSDDDEAMQYLLQSCINSVNGEKPDNEFISKLSESDIDFIDDALDNAAPAVCNRLLVKCPECSLEQYAELNHYDLNCMNKHLFYNEVHTLASHYHWSENAILDLPQSKRRLYIDMINRSKGMAADREMI